MDYSTQAATCTSIVLNLQLTPRGSFISARKPVTSVQHAQLMKMFKNGVTEDTAYFNQRDTSLAPRCRFPDESAVEQKSWDQDVRGTARVNEEYNKSVWRLVNILADTVKYSFRTSLWFKVRLSQNMWDYSQTHSMKAIIYPS